MSGDTRLNPGTLVAAAAQARNLDELLTQCMAEGLLPILTPFDLGTLAARFEDAAAAAVQRKQGTTP